MAEVDKTKQNISAPQNELPANGIHPAVKIGMYALLIAVLIVATSLAIVVDALRKAPEGYEDETGFHLVKPAQRPRTAAILHRKKTGLRFGLQNTHTAKG